MAKIVSNRSVNVRAISSPTFAHARVACANAKNPDEPVYQTSRFIPSLVTEDESMRSRDVCRESLRRLWFSIEICDKFPSTVDAFTAWWFMIVRLTDNYIFAVSRSISALWIICQFRNQMAMKVWRYYVTPFIWFHRIIGWIVYEWHPLPTRSLTTGTGSFHFNACQWSNQFYLNGWRTDFEAEMAPLRL